mgnify:CR=1 FL=1
MSGDLSKKYFISSQLSEMAADLAEEHSTATLATERLEAEQADRMKLEKDKGDLEVRKLTFFSWWFSIFKTHFHF